MALRFVTLFPVAENVHLTKDVGQIPWFFQHHLGYSSSLVCFSSNQDFPALKDEAKGLDLHFIDRTGKKYFIEQAVVDFLHQHARDIDVLNVYHLNRETFYYGNLYKKLNPQGFLYCKLDLANRFLIHGKKTHSANFFKNLVFRRWESKFIRNVDLFSVENQSGLELMKKRYPLCTSKIIRMPNGVNTRFVEEHFQFPEQKEHVVLIMGRIGDVNKNHEILLRVIPHLELKDWKFIFAGPVLQRFKPKVEAFFNEFPEHRQNVLFIGELTKRTLVYDWFRRSAVTCLTSGEESFGLVFVEGLYFGNYLIGTEGMSSFDDISDSGRFGKKLPFNDDEALRATLQEVIDEPEKVEEMREDAMDFARRNFTWPVLVEQLDHEIRKRKARKKTKSKVFSLR